MPGAGLTAPISITQIQINDPVNPPIANQPHADIETNVTMLYQYLLNDGPGSGINSDLLDNQHGAFYLDLTNAVNILPSANFNDTAHGNRAGGSLHALVVSGGANGFMSGTDKAKLDGIAVGANNYVLPNATTSTLGGVIVGSGLSITGGTVSLNAPLATTSTAGQMIVGGNLLVSSGTVSINTGTVPLLASANTFTATQTAPSFNSTSARELKLNLNSVDLSALDFSKVADVKSWDWSEESGMYGHSIGTIADVVADVAPEVVGYDAYGKPATVDYGRLAYLMVSQLMMSNGKS